MITAKRLRRLALQRTPEYFAIIHVIPLQVGKLGLPTDLIGEYIYLVELDEADLPNPACDPVGILGDGKGNRHYMWRNQCWGDYPIHTLPLQDDIIATNLHTDPEKLKDAIERIRRTRVTGAVPQGNWRALYRLPDSEQGD